MEKMAMSPRTQALAFLLVAGLLVPFVPATLGAQTASFAYINQKAPCANPFGVNNPDVKVPQRNAWLFTSDEVQITTPRYGRGLMATMTFPIPNSPHVVGARFHMQVHGAGTAPTGWWFQRSRGCLAVVGS